MENPFRQIYDKMNHAVKTDHVSSPAPLLIDIEITSKCNLKCIMCEHTYMKRKQEAMPWDVFSKIIEQCQSFKPGIRFIMYSEPLLHPDVLSYAKHGLPRRKFHTPDLSLS